MKVSVTFNHIVSKFTFTILHFGEWPLPRLRHFHIWILSRNVHIWILSGNVKPLRERMVHSLSFDGLQSRLPKPAPPLLSSHIDTIFFLNTLTIFRFWSFPRTFFVICDLKKDNPLGDLISLFQRFILSKHNFTFLFQCWYAGVTCVWVPRGITHHRPCHCEITPFLWNYSFEWLWNYLSNI